MVGRICHLTQTQVFLRGLMDADGAVGMGKCTYISLLYIQIITLIKLYFMFHEF